MKLFLSALVIVLILALLRPGLGFRAQRPADYKDTGPAFDLETHLGGKMISEGMIYGPTGRVASRFVAEMNGIWENGVGALSEDFTYDTGVQQQRQWQITLGANGTFTATAPDIIGTAEGQVSGATASLRYRIRLPETAGGHVLEVTDWMYLMENGTILNRSEMRKFRIKVAELVATIRPASGPTSGPASGPAPLPAEDQ